MQPVCHGDCARCIACCASPASDVLLNCSGLLGAYHASVLMIYAMARHLHLKQRPEHCECAGRNSLHLLHARCQLLRSALRRMRNVRSQPIGAALECA